MFYDNGQYLDCLEFCSASLRHNPDNSDALLLKGLCYNRLNFFDSAIYFFNRVNLAKLKLLTNADLYFGRGVAEYNSKNYDKAIEDFDACNKITVDQWKVLSPLGLCYYYINNFDSAVKFIEKSLQLKDIPQLYYFLASSYKQKENYISAIVYYEKSVEANLNLLDSYMQLSYCKIQIENYKEAEYFAKEALNIDTSSPFANLCLANSLYGQEKLFDMLESALKAIKHYPNNPYANFYLAIAYGQRKDSVNSFLYFNKSIGLSKDPFFVEKRV